MPFCVGSITVVELVVTVKPAFARVVSATRADRPTTLGRATDFGSSSLTSRNTTTPITIRRTTAPTRIRIHHGKGFFGFGGGATWNATEGPSVKSSSGSTSDTASSRNLYEPARLPGRTLSWTTTCSAAFGAKSRI